MALQDCQPMDILPHKTLNDLDSMYYYLKQRLNTAKQISDFIPFINAFMSTQELKQQLSSLLDKEYKSEKSQHKLKNKIRPLFVSLFSLNGIPSDNIHAYILSFLPRIEFKKLPILSKHFKYILNNNPYLYNDKGYTVSLMFTLKEEKISNISETDIFVTHHLTPYRNNGIMITQTADTEKKHINAENMENTVIPITQIKRWTLMDEHIFHYNSHGRQINYDIVFDDKHNQFILNYFLKHVNKIEKLTVEFRETIFNNKIFTNNIQLKQCIALTLGSQRRYIDGANFPVLNVNTFANLQCLEIYQSRSYRRRALTMGSLKCVNNMMNLTSNTLKCVKYHNSNSISGTLKVTKNVQWISLNVFGEITIDITECDKLFGVQILGLTQCDKVKWPNNNIPFVCIGEFITWRDMLFSKELKVECICLVKKKQSQGMFSMDTWEFDDTQEIERTNISTIKSKKNWNNNCLILDKQSCDDKLIYKVLQYAVRDEKVRNDALQTCQSWWYLGSANWIKDIGCNQTDT